MPLRNFFLLISGLLVVTGSFFPKIQAQEIKIGGEVSFGMGRFDQESDPPESTSLVTTGEAELIFLTEKAPFSMEVAIGIAASDETENALDTAEFELRWDITRSLKLRVSGRSIGIESAKGNTKVINAPSQPVGNKKAVIDFDEIGLVNLEYSAGAITVGIALSSDCVPQCGYGGFADANNNTSDLSPHRETSTGVIHLRRKTETFSFNAYAASSRGEVYSSQLKAFFQGRGHGAGLGMAFRTGDLELGLDASRAAVKCMVGAVDWDSGGSEPDLCSDDRKISKGSLKVAFAGFGLHYYLGREEAGASLEEVSNFDLTYIFDIKGTGLSVEYRAVITENTDASTVTETMDSVILFGISFEF